VGKFYEGLYEELSLYVRHYAWLNAAPERPKNDTSELPRLSRLEKMRKERKDDKYDPDMPPLEGADHLLSYLLEIGPTMAAGGYPGPITHEELRAWIDLTGIELQPWEARFLRRLSHEYLAESHKAEKSDCPAPWRSDDAKPEVSNTQAAIRALANL
jgi:hypothetical protein